ncbi:ribonuclease III [Legionella londiniensis]|uniref:Ribonuclease 3 n=1 Tax=Legionella londiniensis TaxID=45068 RepID=A0A0W0VP57_9GAMM|nr:ribonuclease III [Legionella londiniensis]KTD21921.1 ribonuclease III [Legionella londiniensis]STX92596.1 ribonuclease III [Legionella londiniensis]
MENNLQRLCRRLDYEFKTPAFLKQALTHCSAGKVNNERLEFLGDSILSFVIANALFERFPKHSEGELSRLRAHLVKGETLAEIAFELNLGDYLYLGQGELKSGGFRRASILADALEAIFAAVYLDGGLPSARHVILHLYQTRLDDNALNYNLKDAKTQLQEFLQAEKLALPEYTLNRIEGEEHNQLFFVTCTVPTLRIKTSGQGASRRKAEQDAAYHLLNQLKKQI